MEESMLSPSTSFTRHVSSWEIVSEQEGKETAESTVYRIKNAYSISIEHINNALVRGPIELVRGVRREEGKQLLAAMGKMAK